MNRSQIDSTLQIYAILLLFICFSTNNIKAQKNVQTNGSKTIEFNRSSDIKTIKIHRLGWELSEPTIELNTNDKLLVSFDDISGNPGAYSYSLIHCDSEWNPSPIFINDFMDGFEVNEVKEFSFSSGTIMDYMHFRLEIPNQDIRLKISGNYLLRIFSTYNHEEVLIQKRFIVFESLLSIMAQIRQPSTGEYRFSGQQLDLKINTSGIRISDPHSEIKTIVCQNYLFQGCIQDIKPTYVKNGELDYSHPDALIFEGVNEFRLFDTRNLRQQGQGVLSIDYHGGIFQVLLKPDESRRRQKYSYYSDLNGRYVVGLERSTQSHIEADYLWTYFTLKAPLELDEGKNVYLFGELTGWQLSPDNRLEYNYQRNAYETRLLLKQGAYSYRYVVADAKTGEVDVTHFEGSHFDTENTYMVLVYYKPLGTRYERIVGYQRISTQK
jgi:hypothetical protein